MQELIKRAAEQLEQKAQILKEELRQERDLNRALGELERTKNELVETIKSLTELGLPGDIIDFYVKHQGKVWASKRFVLEYRTRPEIRLRAWLPIETTELDPGLYKFIFLAVPMEVKPDRDGYITDDYNNRVRLGDC